MNAGRSGGWADPAIEGPGNAGTATVKLSRPEMALGPVSLAVLAVYVLFAEMAWGLFRADLGMAFFPAAGVTLAALVALPRRRWPLILALIVIAEVSVDLRHGVRVPVAVGYAAANGIEPVVGATVMTWLAARVRSPVAELHRRAGMLRFVVGGLVAGPLVGGLAGATVRSLDAPDTAWLADVAHWWAGDGLGVLVVGAPLLVAQRREAWNSLRPHGEALLLLALVIAGSVAVFGVWRQPLVYGLLPLLLWAAFRFDVLGVGIAGATMALIANVATAQGRGPFAALAVAIQTQLGLTQFFLTSTVLTGWFFAIETGERITAVHRVRADAAARHLAETDRAVGAVGRELMSSLRTEDIIDVVSRQVTSRLGADLVVVQLWDQALGASMHSERPLAAPELVEFLDRRDLVSPRPGAQAARTGEPVWASSGDELDQRFPEGAGLRDSLGIESVASLPLLAGDGGVGHLSVLWCAQHTLSDQERSYLRVGRTAHRPGSRSCPAPRGGA